MRPRTLHMRASANRPPRRSSPSGYIEQRSVHQPTQTRRADCQHSAAISDPVADAAPLPTPAPR